MDLEEALMTADGPEEAYKPKEVFHPAYQRLGAWLYHRTLFPDDKMLPDANQLALQNISPLPDVVKKCGPCASKVVDNFEIKKGMPNYSVAELSYLVNFTYSSGQEKTPSIAIARSAAKAGNGCRGG